AVAAACPTALPFGLPLTVDAVGLAPTPGLAGDLAGATVSAPGREWILDTSSTVLGRCAFLPVRINPVRSTAFCRKCARVPIITFKLPSSSISLGNPFSTSEARNIPRLVLLLIPDLPEGEMNPSCDSSGWR